MVDLKIGFDFMRRNGQISEKKTRPRASVAEFGCTKLAGNPVRTIARQDCCFGFKQGNIYRCYREA